MFKRGGGGGGGEEVWGRKKSQKWGGALYSGVFHFFCFVFHAKSGTKNNDRTGLSDISY